jgi:nitroimidazol reductase NimA-like FMN-containing flavoprotein (pyridoxamine 5'-phosphate oxidase superfamily)
LPQMSKDEVEELIKAHFLCRIAFRGTDYPYIAPFQYVYKNGALYFHFTAYGRKVQLLREENRVCVEVEQYAPDLSRYMFVAITGKVSVLEDPNERDEVIRSMRETGQNRLSKNFLAAHGFGKDENWSSFTSEQPLTIVKLTVASKTGLKSP